MPTIASATSSFSFNPKNLFFNQRINQNNPNFSSKNSCFCINHTIQQTPQKPLVSTSSKTCECFDLHNELVPYKDAWDWQKSIVKEKREMIERNGECGDTLILLQHYPVYTLGTASKEDYFNFDVSESPYEIFRTERGGEVTYHGPGQLVMYPIMNLRNHRMDLHWYLRALEEIIIRVLSSTFGIKASRKEGLTGVWVGDEKLAAIGIRVMHWITYHGLALNVTTDLSPFDKIVPCGIRNHGVTSVKGMLSHVDDIQLMEVASKSILKEFSEVFQLKLEFVHRKPSFLHSRNHESVQV